jgi:PAS domain S-box-containing protein
MDRNSDRGVLIGVGLVTALLVVNAAITYRNTRQINEDAGWVARTHEVLDLTGNVMLGLVDAETGERGFLLTDREEYLQPYLTALPRLNDRLARLKEKTAHDPSLQDQVKSLEAMIAKRLTLLRERIDLRTRHVRDDEALSAGEEGRKQMQAIRHLVTQMQQSEQGLLRERETRSNRAYAVAVTTGLLTPVLGLAAVGALVGLVRRSLRAREQAAADLNVQREWLRGTLSSIGDAVIATDTEGRVMLLNPVARSLTGWTSEDADRQPLEKVFQIVDERSRRPAENPVTRALREGAVAGLANHTILIARDSSERPIDDSAAPIRDERGNVLGVVLIFRDVTERRRAEEAQRQLAAIVESSDDAIVGKTLDGIITNWNGGAERLYGYTAEEAVGRPFSMLVPPDRPAEAESIEHFETVRCHKDGRLVDVSVCYSPIKDVDGSLVGTSVIARDITQRRRTEAALREAEERFAAVVNHSPSCICVKGRDGRYLLANRAMARLVGRAPEDLIRRTDAELFPPDTAEQFRRNDAEVLAAGESLASEEWCLQDGKKRSYLTVKFPLLNPDGQAYGVCAIATDITPLREAEELRREEARVTEALHRVGSTLSAELDLQPLVQAVTDEATALTEAQFGAFFYNAPDDAGGAHLLYTLSGATREDFAQFPMPRNTALFAPTFGGEGAVRLGDVTRDPRYGKSAPYHGMPQGHLPVRSYLAVPVVSRTGDVLGGLIFGHSEADVFTLRHEHLVVGIAAQAAVAIDNARLYGEVQESEQRFRQLAENIQEVFWMSDAAKTEIFYVSPAYEEMWGRSVESLYARPLSFFEAIHPDDQGHVRAASLDAQSRRELTDVEYRVVRPDGTVRWVRDRSFPVKNASGETSRVVGIAEDITERKRSADALRESEQRFARFMQHLPGLAWIKDLNGRYVYVNDAAEKAFRLPRAELYGKTDSDIFPAETADSFRANDRQALNSEAGVRVIETLEHADGVLRYAVVSKFPIPGLDGRPTLVGGAAVDITDLKRVEEALKDADRRKDEFLAMLAHELRNPLAPISNALHALKLPGATPAVALQARGMMERQVEHMVRLVDDLLDVSRIMRGKIELRRQPVELSTVVARAVETAQPAVDAEGHQLTVSLPSEPLWLDGDLVRLAQVVGNLLHNAAKYTERGGKIGVTAGHEGDEAVLRIRDTGIGIAPRMLPLIFDMFVQAERRTRDARGGLGIGLTLVRRLVEMHGGTVAAYSEGPGKGSEFEVRLPLLPRHRIPGKPRQHAEPTALKPAARRILIVDDSADAASSLALMLRLRGYNVRVTHDAFSALEHAANDCPDVALLDLGMPQMDGYELARRFRGHPSLCSVLLVAVTGWGQEEDRRRTKEAGFDYHLVKPVELDALEKVFARSDPPPA